MKNSIPIAMSLILAGCGGGGGGSNAEVQASYDYAKLNGKYSCKIISTSEIEIFAAEFSDKNLHLSKINGAISDVKDVTGFVNGYPRYSNKIGVDEAVTFFFTVDGLLSYGRGKFSGIENLIFNPFQVSICSKS